MRPCAVSRLFDGNATEPTMTAIAIKGKGAMPPKGGSTASDADIKSAVEYMANAAK